MDTTCVFCKIIRGEIPSHKIYEDEHYFAFLDIHPISLGHTLIIPKKHSPDFVHATSEDRKGLLEIAAKITPSILKEVHSPAFNIGINTGKESGQIIFHTHMHIIPRKEKDGLSSWKNTAITDEKLSITAQRIRENLSSFYSPNT
ncbi:MAG: HIT family protein [Candidatus Diapherotrites archaeon]